MSIRRCVYKDCDNYSIVGVPPNEQRITLFSFPKDDRREQWLQLGQVSDDVPANELVMCSDHFPDKYKSINQRRTILLRNAIPFAYEAIDESSPKRSPEMEDSTQMIIMCRDPNQIDLDDNEMDLLAVIADNDDAIEDIDDLTLNSTHQDEDAVESTSPDNEDDIINMVTIPTVQKEIPSSSQLMRSSKLSTRKRSQQSTSDPYRDYSVTKRHVSQDYTQPDGSKAESLITCRKYGNNTDDMNTSIDIDDSNVSTFIFKNEEYVQMRKSYYLEEKRKLLRLLYSYKMSLKKIQSTLDDIDVS